MQDLDPTATAVVMEHGQPLTYADLEDRSMRIAQMLRARGIQIGDRVAVMLRNSPTSAEMVWATRRAGLYFVPVNFNLTVGEAAHIVSNSDAKVLVVSSDLIEIGREIARAVPNNLLILTDVEVEDDDVQSLAIASATYPAEQLPDQPDGLTMGYSSGTTGKPKGILRPLGEVMFGEERVSDTRLADHFGLSSSSTLLLPAPLYYAAPLGWMRVALGRGARVVLLDRFDAETVLRLIERERATHAFFVPTHFIRLLKLSETVREQYDVSSLKIVTHAGAPCPVEVKQRMLRWWGPIIYEFYAGSEAAGMTSIAPGEWLGKPGSVGHAIQGVLHIVDDAGTELPPGEVGAVYFEGATPFRYHKDEEKTAEFFDRRGWGTLGDMGWLDEDGYLFLADRKSNMIISGGVNIFPQEIESELVNHPAVLDVAVIGVPNAEFGEEVKALILPTDGVECGDALKGELLRFCRARLAGYKCPRSIDFVDSLPRLSNGKLLKRQLRKQYWGENKVQII